MRTYNRSLDCITLAMAYAAKGNVTASAKMFNQAMQQPDVKRAIATLEASNKQAFKATASAKKIKANDDIDMGDEEDLDALVGDNVDEDFAEDEVEEAAFDEDDEEDDEEEFDGAEFAKVLASLTKPKAKSKTRR